MSKIDPTKFIFNCTIEEFVEVMKNYFPSLAGEMPLDAQEEDGPTFKGRLVYGVDGIIDFFHISRKTYYNWLPWLKEPPRLAMGGDVPLVRARSASRTEACRHAPNAGGTRMRTRAMNGAGMSAALPEARSR